MMPSSHGGLLAVLDGGLVVMVCKLQQHEQGSLRTNATLSRLFFFSFSPRHRPSIAIHHCDTTGQ